MKKQFKIQSINNSIVVLPLTNKKLDELSSVVEKDLVKLKYTGSVIFDLIVSTGLSSNRHVIIKFENNKFNYKTISNAKISDAITDLCNTFYSKHISIIKESALARIEKHNISKLLEKKLQEA